MDNYQGDLTDIIRASGGALKQSDVSNWEFPSDPSISAGGAAAAAMEDNNNNDDVFGDPFCNMRDPLLHELNVAAAAAAGSGYFSSTNSTDHMLSTSVDHEITSTKFSSSANNFAVFEEEMINRSSLFSRIQISPSSTNNNNNSNSIKLPVSPCGDSPVLAAAAAASSSSSSPRPSFINKPPPMVSIDMINTNSSKNCLIENPGPVQISSPRNLGIKRRKSQAKKVVCIPAPAAANSRPSGEVVPSDLWAWRKYGQKPIKGSPYPRGYYRCSSSKGCSARKQVERSRTDPNMLVITYTSEHNHPWPTQRNALAGSTRSQPPKNTSASSQPQKAAAAAATTKEEQKESSNDTLSPKMVGGIGGSCRSSTAVKEEINEEIDKQMLEMEDSDQLSSYRPSMPAMDSSSHQSEDFFADLGEIEADPLDLLFSQGFTSSTGDHDQKESKALDPFGLFDWSANINNNNNNNISFGGEARRGL